MKKILTSFGFDSHSNLLQLSIPSFYHYAHKHNYDFFIPSKEYFSDTTKQRPYSWWKIELIKKLFNKYDRILWIDADMVVCDSSKDIFDDFEENSHVGMVVHECPDGSVPNCGLWLLDKKCLEWFDQLWDYNNFQRSNSWWEQAAMIYKLGVNPDNHPIELPSSYSIPWTKLDYKWNPHIYDHRGIPEDIKFFHSTMMNDKETITKKILKKYQFYI